MTPFAQIVPGYAVAGQLTVDDVARAAEAGFRTIVCNRPAEESDPADAPARIAEACERHGLAFVENPFSHAAFSPDLVRRQAEAIAASDGPVLAYCRSGQRSTVLWALAEAEAGRRSVAELLELAARAGYDLSGVLPMLEAYAAA
ncbi:MAG: TIGR01244 family phosphatase [Alphaproteobacteria bacterium]|nr:MAG: TIGR01244 family phosphatase [Alphaproteobacteria bacterium]